MDSSEATKLTLPRVLFCLAFFPLLLAGLQGVLRLSHAAADWRFENRGVSVRAVIVETEHVVLERKFGGETHQSEHWWVRYLPEGKENVPENIIWEAVFPSEFESYFEGQRIEAWLLPDAHRIKGRGEFKARIPEWGFVGVGGLLIGLGMLLRSRTES